MHSARDAVHGAGARERVRDLALAALFAELAVGELGYDAPPEADRAGIARLLGDRPLARVAREDQHRGAAADAAVAVGLADEELAQAEAALRVLAREAALHDGEAHRLLFAQHQEGGAAVVVEPALDDLPDALARGRERGKDAGRVGGEV